jgi:hypothetical protein
MTRSRDFILLAAATMVFGCASSKERTGSRYAPQKSVPSSRNQSNKKSDFPGQATATPKIESDPTRDSFLDSKPKTALRPVIGNRPRPLKGGAYDNEATLRARRIGPKIILPEKYGQMAPLISVGLPQKPEIAVVVVENDYLRKRKTRGISFLLKEHPSVGGVLSLESLSLAQDFNSLINTMKSKKVDLLVILQKLKDRQFVIIDIRNSQLLAMGDKNSEQVVGGHAGLSSLHGRLCKIWNQRN